MHAPRQAGPAGLARLALIAALWAQVGVAHESWIAPQHFRVAAGERIVANIRVGQDYKGSDYSYNPAQFERLGLRNASGVQAIRGRLGDIPAIRVRSGEDGLHVLVYHSAAFTVKYESYARFAKFIDREGLQWVHAAHRQRALPQADFSELYNRYAKALLAVGTGAGEDAPSGMPFELLALDNPYTAAPGAGIRVRLLWQGRPMSGALLSIYRKLPGRESLRTTVRTDAGGEALVARGEGGQLLLNAVHMTALETSRTLALVWESHWASMTFQWPAQ